MDDIEALRREYKQDEWEEANKQRYVVTIKEITIYKYLVYELNKKEAEDSAEIQHADVQRRSQALVDTEYEIEVI